MTIPARVLCSAFLLIACVFALHAPAKAQTPPKKLVLCWYMVCFGNSVEGYKQEIELAQRHGIDGFLLDVGEWRKRKGDGWQDTNYVQSAERMYEAARQLNSGFVLAMAPEYSVQPFTENVYDMVTRFHTHPNQLKHDGKIVLSGYCAVNMFAPVMAQFKTENVPVTLITHAFLPRFTYNPTVDVFEAEFAAAPYLDGLMMFNAHATPNVLSDNTAARRATLKLGKICAAGVIPAYNSANLNDHRGLSGYLKMWQGAINDGADWISLVIWNDYNEDSAIMPSRWPSGSERYLYDRDESFLFATAYASAWFKSGKQPEITQDRVFITYRSRSKWQRKAWTGKEWVDVSLFKGRFDQIHDDVEDLVYLDTFLTAPATLTLRIGKQQHQFSLPTGVGHAEAPLTPGVPRVTLQRGKQVVLDILGRRQIIDQPTERNSLVGYHHVNRTWASGTVAGPVALRLEAERGTLTGEATIVTSGAVSAVKNAEKAGSGVTLPVEGLATGTYNVHITYANPSTEDARLTLYADGPPRAAQDHPYFIPAYLPPTEKGGFQTVSFLWSLYDTTRTLKVQWMPGKLWGRPDPQDDDYGTVLLDAIEFIKVEPVRLPSAPAANLPALIAIPGGQFTMGSAAGEPDELPRHAVTLSPFAIGKYEVTNAEFERFDPSHRQFRNGNSWRDREPVLHVSWTDAAKYCNWLSGQHGLTPIYDEKTWVANLTADGFRLPTEAEWEYIATGRGEGRPYPWGKETPVPGVHGWFAGRAALENKLPQPATAPNGVVVVGAFPAGASRDGVMDLAGNVGEWCTDWYAPYPAGAQTDPCQQEPGNYRVIRGGSWGWYGYSQRAADREFNSQNYPGHAYYGFRVAIGDAGWRKLQAAGARP